MDLTGIGPVVAARILADVGDTARFADRNRFASWTGTAPVDASSGEQIRHRLSRAGNRKMNHVLHSAAACPARLDTRFRGCYRRSSAMDTRPKAMRCLKRRISDAVYRQLVADARRAATTAASGAKLQAGRALRGVTHIQRGRLSPARRHFGSAPFRTRSGRAPR
jgi:transposase